MHPSYPAAHLLSVRKAIFLFTIILVLIFNSCSTTTTPITYTNSENYDFVILGIIHYEGKGRIGFQDLMQAAKRQYPTADYIIDIMIDKKVSKFLFINYQSTTYVMRATAIQYIRRNIDGEIIRVPTPTQSSFSLPTVTRNRSNTTAMDPNELTVGINLNPAGLSLFGPSLCIEFTKGSFNSEINLIYPLSWALGTYVGAGGLVTFNYFKHSPIGGFYVGGGIGYTWAIDYISYQFGDSLYYWDWDYRRQDWHLLTFGANIGYKFVTQSGMYYRTGVFAGAGVDFGYYGFIPYFKPDLTIGYCF
ncbi:MAG: hypothetical protein FWD22_01550 [Treponema sp.]|nr:hypothetical protein [Treponema sp.]